MPVSWLPASGSGDTGRGVIDVLDLLFRHLRLRLGHRRSVDRNPPSAFGSKKSFWFDASSGSWKYSEAGSFVAAQSSLVPTDQESGLIFGRTFDELAMKGRRQTLELCSPAIVGYVTKLSFKKVLDISDLPDDWSVVRVASDWFGPAAGAYCGGKAQKASATARHLNLGFMASRTTPSASSRLHGERNSPASSVGKCCWRFHVPYPTYRGRVACW